MVEMIGNQHSATQVWHTIQQWDQAVSELDIDTLLNLCEPDIKMFDISSEIDGVAQYQQLWQQYCTGFFSQFQLQRKDMKIYAQDDLAFVSCHSQVSYLAQQEAVNLADWCRTSMCFQRREGRWRLSHQHISVAQKTLPHTSLYQ